MATNWDSTPYFLPTNCLQGSFNQNKVDGVLRTQMDMGYAKLRPRFTATPTNYSARYFLSSTQRTQLDALYFAYQGVTFTWPHPVSGASTPVRFMAPPSYADAPGTDVYATVNLEALP